MTKRINGTPDRSVYETDTFGGGGGSSGGGVTQDTVPWIVDDPDTQTALATILAELALILSQLQSTLDVAVTNEVEVKNDAGNPLAVAGTVGVSNFPAFPADYPDALAEASLAVIDKKFIPSDGTAKTFATSGNHIIHACPAGQRLRLLWIGLATNDQANLVIVEVLIGATVVYRWPVGAFAHGMVRLGDIDEDLSVNLGSNQTVYINYDLEEVA